MALICGSAALALFPFFRCLKSRTGVYGVLLIFIPPRGEFLDACVIYASVLNKVLM
jgi:hypothetical protein